MLLILLMTPVLQTGKVRLGKVTQKVTQRGGSSCSNHSSITRLHIFKSYPETASTY